MVWSTLFSAANIWALGAWVILIFLPRKELLLTIILYLGVAMMCLTYLIFMALMLSDAVDPGGTASGSPGIGSIEAVRALFSTDAGIFIGWVHYLAFDLFVGLWIARDADSKQVNRFVQAPFLFLTFMVGPIGLFFWLVFREPAARRMAKAKPRGI
jgi:hypothetical protein